MASNALESGRGRFRGIAVTATAIVVIVLAGCLAWSNTFSVPFIFDDATGIRDNVRVRSLWPLWKTLSPELLNLHRPIAQLSFALNYAFGGLNLWGYHATNLLIHLLAALTLFGIVRRTFSGNALRERFAAHATPLALVIALLWVVHPLQTESVTYLIHRQESLMGLFLLLTLYCAIRGSESNRWAWQVASVVFCALGMGTKERMVVAPVMVLLYDRAFLSGMFAEALRRRRVFYVALASTWAILGAVIVFSPSSRVIGFGLGVTCWESVRIQIPTIVHYLQLSFWPNPLVLDYGHPPTPALGEIIPSLVLLSALLVLTVAAVVRWPRWGFPSAWFFVVLAPSSSFIPVNSSMEEHQMYLPLAGVVALVVAAVYVGGKWALRRTLAGERARAVVGGTLAVALSVASAGSLGYTTYLRNGDYKSAVSIWEDTIGKEPLNPRARNNLGFVLARSGRTREAIEQYQEALRLNPDYDEAHNNLGAVLIESGRTREAIEHIQEALRLKRDFGEANYNLGLALAQSGRTQEAVEQYQKSLRLKPDHAETHNNLGVALAQSGRMQEAVEHFREAVRLKPDYAEAQYNLGLALAQSDRMREAVEHLEDAVKLKPDYAEAHDNLGNALAKTGRISEAIAQYQEALRLKSDYVGAHYNLGNALAESGPDGIGKAIEQYKEALRLKPDFAQAHNNLGLVLARSGQTQEAIEQYQQALRLKPDYLDALKNLQAAQQKLLDQP